MADTLSAEATALATVGAILEPGAGPCKTVGQYNTFTIASQGIADTLTCQPVPTGARIEGFELLSSVSLATSTISIGIAGTAAKYRAAATFTTVGQWVKFMLPSGFGTTLTAAETPILTVGVAALPASGTLVVKPIYTVT